MDRDREAMPLHIPSGWKRLLAGEMSAPYFRRLDAFVDAERRAHVVYPPERDVFTALRLTPYARVRAVILGQDPYPGEGQAHGLAFSVRPGAPLPGSLRNVFRELADDLGCGSPTSGSLVPWARQGVFLLNAVLTVRAGQPGSHRGRGWESFTDAVIRLLNERRDPLIFTLWGREAQKKGRLIDPRRHVVIRGVHPSPMSAGFGFFGSRPFSKMNAALRRVGRPEIDWRL